MGATWEEIEKLAAEEGTLTLSVMSIPGFAAWAEYANKQLPTIDLQVTSISPDSFVPRVVTEQDNGAYLWDAMVGPLTNTYAGLHPDRLAPADEIFADLPADLTADARWAGGFSHFSDPNDHRSFINEYLLGTAIYVNRDEIPEKDISSPADLLDAKWRGKICVNDPRMPNQATMGLAWFLESEKYGEKFVTDLLKNQKVLLTDSIATTSEWFATGRCSIAIGPDARTINELKKTGVKIDYEVLDDYGNYLLSWGTSILKNAPHPNATRVFLAWFLSEDGQKSYVDMVRADATTRLLGVEPGPAGAPTVDFENLDSYPVRAGTSAGAAAVKRMTTLAEKLLS
ncbi:iron(III) transport system substrate-binding protein [Arthrobacter ginsengisoli]|uniref:Iron(III) transport system substrate-binding protein n=1 Tax=Arthrobacter ginsengisoli TaxID=1356565 RepID=A0ABU1UDN1_9MICC|nr:extracellular solute-binding protein [Arthrobacter ginsengisoli]MDR7083286.1 iron(III) transport system substrate-binding protein [Arthrobacter ginsengisoli]